MKVSSNIKEIIQQVAGELFSPENADRTLRAVASTMLAKMQTRIYEEGLGTSGARMGSYSRNPIYVSILANPGKSFGRPIGKTGRSKFSDGRDHKSRYFPGGYDEFKTVIGRNPGYVNLSLSGQLNSQMTVIALSDGYGIGWTDTEKFDRAEALDIKYGGVWGLTEDELKEVNEIALREFIN